MNFRTSWLILVATTATTTAFTSSPAPARSLSGRKINAFPSLHYVASSDIVNGLAEELNEASMPILGDDGLYHIENADQHAALLATYPNHIVVLKCFAPWCRACKGLAPKFLQIRNDEKYGDLPIVWADLTIAHNKAFVKSLGVLALPTVQFYVAGQLQDTFPCGPSKVPILKRKLTALINTHVDAATRTLKEEFFPGSAVQPPPEATPQVREGVMERSERERYVQHVPYLQEMSLADQDDVLDKARLETFDIGEIIMREGEDGNSFYMIRTGQVEVCQEVLGAGDPLVAPDFLGTLINILEGPMDFFGERALMTGEPRAASIRASTKVNCWVLDKEDFPASSVLSGRTRQADKGVDDKYGVSLLQEVEDSQKRQLEEVSKANQQRGSVNTPQQIAGVDYEVDATAEVRAPEPVVEAPAIVDNDAIFNTLCRFHMIRRVSTCLKYMEKARPVFDEGNRNRRNVLVQRLSSSRRAEFRETFEFLDTNNDGYIEKRELSRVIASLHDEDGDRLIQTLSPRGADNAIILNKDDFIGIMAEAEFFGLFRDIFASLDKYQSGYVKARDLDRVLCGVRDLISDDRKSLIDLKDKDMLIDYEQFSRLLLGTTLK